MHTAAGLCSDEVWEVTSLELTQIKIAGLEE